MPEPRAKIHEHVSGCERCTIDQVEDKTGRSRLIRKLLGISSNVPVLRLFESKNSTEQFIDAVITEPISRFITVSQSPRSKHRLQGAIAMRFAVNLMTHGFVKSG